MALTQPLTHHLTPRARSERLGVGVGVVHQSRFASISNAVALPAYTRVDAAVFVSVGDGFEAQANIENLFN